MGSSRAPADVCFASLAVWHGCVTSCRNAAALLGGDWLAFELTTSAVEIDRSELLVLSGWEKGYERLLTGRRRPTAIRWHSPLLQSELSAEGWRLARILEHLDRGLVAALAVNDAALVEVLGRDRVVFLPDVLDPKEYRAVMSSGFGGTNVSLFGAAHHRKNLFTQAAAFELVRRSSSRNDLTLHLNGQSLQNADLRSFLTALPVRYVEHGFLARAEYLSVIAGMDAGLSATLSESYCYVAADHISLGVPVVTSPAVVCADAGELEVDRPASADAVAERLRLALDQPSLVETAKRSLEERATASLAHARAGVAKLRELAGQMPGATPQRQDAST